MTKVLHSEDWIHVEEYPSVDFQFQEVLESKKRGQTIYELLVRGDFTLRGITKQLYIPVTISFLPGKLSARQKGKEGDLLILRSNFQIQRKDFNIKPEMDGSTVATEIQINLGIVGISPR